MSQFANFSIRKMKLFIGKAIFNFKWRITCVIRVVYVFFFCIRTRRARSIKIHYSCEIRNNCLIRDYGNFSMLIQLQRLLTIQGHFCSIQIQGEGSEAASLEIKKYISDLSELRSRFCLPEKVYENIPQTEIVISKHLFRKINLFLQFEHFVPYLIYSKSKSIPLKDIALIPIPFSHITSISDSNQSEIIGWGYRINPSFPHRNSKDGDFIDYLHALLALYSTVEIVFLGSEEARQKVEILISKHREEKCKCNFSYTYRFQELDGFLGAVNELQRVNRFFTDGGHGLCDFVLGTTIPFILVTRFSRYHPKELQSGFPWMNESQSIFISKQAFFQELSAIKMGAKRS